MSFELGESKPPDELFFERKALAPERASEEDAFQSDMVHKDLFETISEAHYLPELGGPHDEALLESLVEKGCEDNQILGQALDKLAHLVHESGEYHEEDDILLGGPPVADIIDRLEHSLESPSRSSITAAQGLLHLHHIGDHLPPPERPQRPADQTYITGRAFTPAEPPMECTLETLNTAAEIQETNDINPIDFGQNAEERLQSEVNATDVMYTERVPDLHETYESKTLEELPQHSLPDQSEVTLPSETNGVTNVDTMNVNENLIPKIENNDSAPCDINRTDDNALKQEDENMDFMKELEESSNGEELIPTDLSINNNENNVNPCVAVTAEETANSIEDNLSDKSDDQPKDLSVHRRLPTPHASPRRIDIPRAPSRESDAMQSPQPSGIPAVPSSPEIFTMPHTKSKQTLFLETLLSSPSPKMYTSEVTITKQQCEPLNLGKNRKSASPTVTSCSDEIRKLNKEYGEPQEKRMRRGSTEDLAKISKVFNKCADDQITESKSKKPERPPHKPTDEMTPLKQLQILKMNHEFNIPDPMLIPKDKLRSIIAAPGIEIPALLMQRPELRLPEAFSFPAVLRDPNILVVSLSQLENLMENERKQLLSPKPKEPKSSTTTKAASCAEHTSTSQPDQTNQPKSIPSMDALAGDIDAATSAALNQMLWLPYISQLEAMAACSQNMEFLKALNSSGYTGTNYPDLSQMFNQSARFMGPSGFPMMPPMDYDNRLQFAMWQEAMNQNNARSKPNSIESHMKEIAPKSSDVQNPYVHSTKNHQSKSHMSSRTSPMTHNYAANQRAMAHNAFLQNMYPGMNPNVRPNVPLPGLQIPYYNPNLMGSQRSPRSSQQKSPTSPYYPNNNYLHSVKHSEAQAQHRGNASSSQESPRPRISVKSLHNLLEPAAAAVSGVGSSRRGSNPPAAMGRRREEPEVGSTTPLGEPPVMPPHPHDPASFPLWHPLFGNQKSYNSPWSWTTVTATGD